MNNELTLKKLDHRRPEKVARHEGRVERRIARKRKRRCFWTPPYGHDYVGPMYSRRCKWCDKPWDYAANPEPTTEQTLKLLGYELPEPFERSP